MSWKRDGEDLTPRAQGMSWKRDGQFWKRDGQFWRRAISFAVNNAGVTYTTNVGIGSPPRNYSLLIDTGSSNTWIGAVQPYVKTESSIPTNEDVQVYYGIGFFSGSEFLDTVTLAPGFSHLNIDGILGLTAHSTSELTIPTVTDNLFANYAIDTETVGIFYAPTTADSSVGELNFGGIDTNKITSPVHFVPFTATKPSSAFWGIDLSISFGDTTILNRGAGIVDTGSTFILIAHDEKATGGVLDPQTGLLSITAAQFENLKPLDFNIGEKTFSLTPNAQIWPHSLNTAIKGSPDSIFLIVADMGSLGGNRIDFILGYTFLQRFYSVYDTTNKQVGFATTAFTNANTN